MDASGKERFMCADVAQSALLISSLTRSFEAEGDCSRETTIILAVFSFHNDLCFITTLETCQGLLVLLDSTVCPANI